MNIRIPLLFKITAPLVLLITITIAVSGYRVYRESTERFEHDRDIRLERLAEVTAASIPIASLQQVREPLDLMSEAYAEVEAVLNNAASAGNLNWIGIYYREGGVLYYWVDNSRSGVGYPFFYATPEHFAALDNREVRRVEYADEFGSYYGFVAPILIEGDDGPQAIGLVEVVIDGESAQLIERDTLRRVLPILIGGSIIAIFITVLVTAVVFDRPLQQLEQGALALAHGEFGYTIDLASRDELGDLAATFNQMSLEIDRLHREQIEAERKRREEEVARLQESERILEEKVAERTFELVRRNQELTRAQAELAEARDKAVAADRAKSEFVSFAAHELKVPMTSIKGYAELLAAGNVGPVNENQISMLRTISAIVDRMATLVSDLADISRIESGMLRLNCRPLSLAEVINEVVTASHYQINERRLSLSVNLPPDLPLVQADHIRLVQVLTNLVSNAYKYTPPGGRITIEAKRVTNGEARRTGDEPSYVQVSVADTGIGIKPEDYSKVFTKFFRADDRIVNDTSGTGLGLNITRHLVELQGGRIWFESEYGRGTTFYFTIPAAE